MTVIDRLDAATGGITITPKSPTIGAEITGVDLAEHLSDEAIGVVRQA